MNDKLEKYYKWYEEQYASIINLKKLDDKADSIQNNWLKTAVQNFKYGYSSIWRHEVLSTMRYYILPKKIEYICTSFKIIRIGSSSIVKNDDMQYHTIHAILYTSLNKQTNKLKFEFVSTSPTFKSSDGEYRHRFITFDQLLRIKSVYINVFDLVEQHLISQMINKDIVLEHNHLIPSMLFDNKLTKGDINKLINDEIDRMRLPILLYISTWIVDIFRYSMNILENHLADGYKEALFSSDDLQLYKKLIDISDYDDKLMYSLIRFYKDDKQRISVVDIGQKFIPMNIYDIESIANIKLKSWREIYISSVVGNLVINGITPSFPILNDWFFIQGNSFAFWDNKISQLKIDHSNVAKEIIKKLELARSGTYLINPIEKSEMYISYNMEGLSNAIEIPMEYAEQEIIMSDLILCSLNEHMGRTIADIPQLMMNDQYAMLTGPLFQDYRLFSKFIFDFVYA